MLRLIYDEDMNSHAMHVRTTAGTLRIMARDKRNRLNTEERNVLSIAVGMLRNFAETIDNQSETCDNVGNLYKFHITEQSAYDEGYNAAIREVLSLLKKGDNNAEDI